MSLVFWTFWPLHFPCHHFFVPFRHQFFNIFFRNWWRLITTVLEIVGTSYTTAVVSLFLRITELHFSWHTVIVFGSLIQHGATWLDCLWLLFKSLKVASEFEKILCGTAGDSLEKPPWQVSCRILLFIWSILLETADAPGFWRNSWWFPAVHHWRN